MSQGFVNPYTYATSAPTVTSLTSGSGTYTTPAGVKFLVVELLGGGGGGAGGGVAGTSGLGSNGSNTTFGALTGNGGTSGGGGSGGGTGSGGNILNMTGNSGSQRGSNGSTFGGIGGAGVYGGCASGGDNGVTASANGGSAIANSGAGGGGGGCNSGGGGDGGGGGGGAGGYVRHVYTSPASTYSYAVGSGGAGGAAGTSGGAGGSGAAGLIIIYEYYEVLGIPTTLTLPLPIANGGTGISSAPIANIGGTCTGTLNTSWNTVIYPTVLFDTTSSYNASTGVYTCPVKGRYVIYASFSVSGGSITAGQYVGIGISISGGRVAVNVGRAAISSGNGTFTSQVSSIYECNAGDTISIVSRTEYGTPFYAQLLDNAEFRLNITCVGSY